MKKIFIPFSIFIFFASCGNINNQNTTNGFGIKKSDFGVYTGYLRNDTINGIGQYIGNDGGGFIGEWKNNKWNGIGKANWQTGQWKGDQCIAEFQDHDINGFTHYIFKDGTEHLGYYLNGKQDGIGIRKWKNNKWDGDYYIGEWKDGKINGFGKYFDKSEGKVREGIINTDGTFKEQAFTYNDSLEIATQLNNKLEELQKKLNTTTSIFHRDLEKFESEQQ